MKPPGGGGGVDCLGCTRETVSISAKSVWYFIFFEYMHTRYVRKIDYWLGIPCCFLITALKYILKLFSLKSKKDKPVKKILFVKFLELGAIILAYPLLKQLKSSYPSAELFFVTFYKNKDIFHLLQDIIPDNHVLVIREKPRLFILDTFLVIKRLRKEKIDIVFDLEFFSRFSALFSYLVKSEKIIGFYHYSFEGLYRGNLLTHKIQYNPLNHITKNYLSFSFVIEQAEKTSPQMERKVTNDRVTFPLYTSNNQIRKRLLFKLKDLGVNIAEGKDRIFLINPGEGILPLREWPIENFIYLSKLILEERKHYIVIVGTEGAEKKARDMLKNINNPRCVSLVNQTELDELMELFVISDSLISNDCGLAHLAMLAPIRKFILFGPESPQVFGPLAPNSYPVYSNWSCSPCLSVLNHRDSACEDNQCLKIINPEYVYNLILENPGS